MVFARWQHPPLSSCTCLHRAMDGIMIRFSVANKPLMPTAGWRV
jgi:hypothetical protein